MGMAVKGAAQHQLIVRAIDALVEKGLTPEEMADAQRLRDRAEMALERISDRKRLRAARRQSA